MALKDTVASMQQHLDELLFDLKKAAKGNRAAAQRVRTGTIKFTKLAKIYRKESVAAEKGRDKPVKKKRAKG